MGQSGAESDAALSEVVRRLSSCWRRACQAFGRRVIHQTALPQASGLIDNNEHRLPGSPAEFAVRVNEAVRGMADDERVDLLDWRVAWDGLDAWHDPALWRHSKQTVSLTAGPSMATSSCAFSPPRGNAPRNAWRSTSKTPSGEAR